MKSESIIKAIQLLYPNISFLYFYSQSNGEPWENPIDGLVWENTQYPKPTWAQIEPLLAEIELQKAKEVKIAEIKEKRDVENIKPLIRQGNLVNPATMEILPETIQFYFVATRHPTNQASDAGTLLEQAQKRGLIPYFTKNVATNQKAVIALTAELSTNIENHLLNRNATNYYHYGQLEAQINNATTIEQVEAITW